MITCIKSPWKFIQNLFDDLIATGGSAKAASDLVLKCGGNLVEFIFIVELTGLSGSKLLNAPTYSLLQFDE